MRKRLRGRPGLHGNARQVGKCHRCSAAGKDRHRRFLITQELNAKGFPWRASTSLRRGGSAGGQGQTILHPASTMASRFRLGFANLRIRFKLIEVRIAQTKCSWLPGSQPQQRRWSATGIASLACPLHGRTLGAQISGSGPIL